MLLLACLLAFGVAATEFEPDSQNAFDITYTGTAGEYYALIIVAGEAKPEDALSVTEDNLQYINQQTADPNGNVTFEDVLLKNDGTECSVYLSGSDLDGPVLLGYVNLQDEFVVSGTVTSDSDVPATVSLTDLSDETKVYTVYTSASGTYVISVPAGEYKMVITKVAHLSYTKLSLKVADDISGVNAALKGGDVNRDGIINELDLGSLLTYYNKANALVDINSDGVINELDLGKLLTNYMDEAVEQ